VAAFGPLGEHVAAHSGVVDLVVELGQLLVPVGDVFAVRFGGVALGLGVGAGLDPPQLLVGGVVGCDDRLALEVPAFAALCSAEILGAFGARRADGGEGVPARYEHGFGLPGGQVGAPELHRSDARAVLERQVLDYVSGQRHRQPLSPCLVPPCGVGHPASPPFPLSSVVRSQRSAQPQSRHSTSWTGSP
jgi:hypothetical protein